MSLIYEELITSHASEVIKALFDKKSRDYLKQTILKNYEHYVNDDENKIEYILSECIGIGFIERLLKSKEITDIGWNGNFLTVETPDTHLTYSRDELGVKDIESYINKVAAKFSNAVGKAFNDSYPILDSAFNNIRLNAVHHTLSPAGTTLSLRVVRNSLALTKENFSDCFAPIFILNFLEKIMKTGCNIAISGVVGTGKTELQKLAFSFVNDFEKIITIEDVSEMQLKELYPKKDIYSWVINGKVGIPEEVKASLRNNPAWIVVSETRGSEAYEMYQALMTGHFLVTTLHAQSAKKIPRRFVGMCMGKYQLDEAMLTDDLLTTFDFGFHIKKVFYKGKTLRYLSEIIEFDKHEHIVLFQQEFRCGKFYITSGNQLSEQFLSRMAEKNIDPYHFPKKDATLIEKRIIQEIEKQNDFEYQNSLFHTKMQQIIRGE